MVTDGKSKCCCWHWVRKGTDMHYLLGTVGRELNDMKIPEKVKCEMKSVFRQWVIQVNILSIVNRCRVCW